MKEYARSESQCTHGENCATEHCTVGRRRVTTHLLVGDLLSVMRPLEKEVLNNHTDGSQGTRRIQVRGEPMDGNGRDVWSEKHTKKREWSEMIEFAIRWKREREAGEWHVRSYCGW